MNQRCPRCGAVIASVEYLGEVAERLAEGNPSVRRILEAVRTAGTAHDLWVVMVEMERVAPRLAAAFGCYVGTCSAQGGRPANALS